MMVNFAARKAEAKQAMLSARFMTDSSRRSGFTCNSSRAAANTTVKQPDALAGQPGPRASLEQGLSLRSGTPLPLGATVGLDGVNFALFSRHATRVELLLYDSPDDANPSSTIALDPVINRTGEIWHIWVGGLTAGQCYAYRVDGPYRPHEGLRFNRWRVLADPYARAFTGVSSWDFDRARAYDGKSPVKDLSFAAEDNGPYAARAIALVGDFDWRGDRPPAHPWSRTIIYETHVRGLTIHPSARVEYPGTYRAVIAKIPYFKELGVTALEFLPIQEFNENEMRRVNPLNGARLRNYWGYNPVAFFAPKETYASFGRGAQVTEFKEMVRALHAADLEVILDVVFNHTAEGDESGPTLSLRGIENQVYYLLSDDRRHYKNFSGCGNTLNCNHPVVRELILDCLRHWVIEMHVDGFRFDLAAILGRDELGNCTPNAPLLERIAEDPILRNVKLIAEAWDAGGAYMVGHFPGLRWSEWNGQYRDDVRRFWRGDSGMAGALASRLCGSADIYERAGRAPLNSINFVTCHDGFTLRDLVSYADKHNEANGENNRDGSPANFSCNYGVEGETEDPWINTVRLRQAKNLLATLMLSRGVPMLLGGDEFGRTQGGNNNAYCQDNEVSWYDWRLTERYRELLRFTRRLIEFRVAHRVLREERFYTADEILWFNACGGSRDWSVMDRNLACLIRDVEGAQPELYLMANAEEHEVEFRLPSASTGGMWRIALDTAARAPNDAPETAARLPVGGPSLKLAARSLVVLESDVG
jgi:isoamylase